MANAKISSLSETANNISSTTGFAPTGDITPLPPAFNGTKKSWEHIIVFYERNIHHEKTSADDLKKAYKEAIKHHFSQAKTIADLETISQELNLQLENDSPINKDPLIPAVIKGVGQYLADIMINKEVFADKMQLSLIESENRNGTFFRLRVDDDKITNPYWHSYSTIAFEYKKYLELEREQRQRLSSNYNSKNTYTALKEYIQSHNGEEPNAGSGKIEGSSELADGKHSWRDVYMAFYRGMVADVPEEVKMKDFIVAKGLRKSRQKYTRENVKEAVEEFIKKNNGKLPCADSGIIEGTCELAGSQNRWFSISMAFNRDKVFGVPEGTTLQEFIRNETEYKTARKPKKRNLTLEAVFNSVAWHVLKTDQTPQATQDKVRYGHISHRLLPLKPDEVNIRYTLAHQTGYKKTWDDVALFMETGAIKGIPEGTEFQTFTQEVAKRLKQGNFACPSSEDVREWQSDQLEIS